MANDKWQMKKASDDRGLFGRVEPADYLESGLQAELLREGDSSPPIVIAVSVAIIATTPVIVTAITAAVVPETVGVADEAQFALDLRPV
jgi:hypothetical protein